MKPTKTAQSDMKFTLVGGTDNNDLHVTLYPDEAGNAVLGSTWVPTDEERQAIALGANVELLVWGTGHPPVAIRLSDHRVDGYFPPYTLVLPTPEDTVHVAVVDRLSDACRRALAWVESEADMERGAAGIADMLRGALAREDNQDA